MRRAIGITMLTVLAACASETQTGGGSGGDGGGGTAGTGGVGGSPTVGEFPTEGPYSAVREDTDDFIYFFPASLEDEETWPALVWFNGLSGYTEDNNYNGLLESIASWGFLVVGGKHSGMNPAEVDQREDLLRRNADADDDWFGKVDEARIAIAGHSLGGFQTTAVSDQYRIATAIQGAGVPTMEQTSPTLFMTSEADEVVESSTVITAFERAINDAWLANHATADHQDPRIDGGVYREPMIAFLRWQLHDDRAGEGWYVGESCGLCTDPSWSFDDR